MARASKRVSNKGNPKRSSAAPEPFAPGGTSVGWTFWNTILTCWRMWFLRYVEGLHPIHTPRELSLGSAYHGLLEGHSATTIYQANPIEYRPVLDEAQRLFVSRKAPGAPPMSPAIVTEQTLMVPGIPMSSKPDRIEETPTGKRIREFKTAATFRETDSQVWAVSGEVIGEMMAAGVDTAIVDIIEKRKGAVRQIEVNLTPEKVSALVGLVESLRGEVEIRFRRWSSFVKVDGKISPSNLDRLFPKSLSNCGYQYGRPCPYYERCWSRSAGSHLYVKKQTSNWRKFLNLE
mgnify:FL=1